MIIKSVLQKKKIESLKNTIDGLQLKLSSKEKKKTNSVKKVTNLCLMSRSI